MRSTRSVVTAVLVGILILAALFVFLSPRDPLPSHNGKTVAEWFEMYDAAGGWSRWNSKEQQESTRAIITGIGGDAVPFLDRVARRPMRLRSTKLYANVLSN